MLGGGIKDGFGWVDAKADRKTSSENRSDIESVMDKCSFDWNGGDSKFHRRETLKDADKKHEWRMSTLKNPGMVIQSCHYMSFVPNFNTGIRHK